MVIKLELTKESTQRELSEEEWAFPIWRWAAFSLFDTLILVSPLTKELIYPGGSDSRFYLGKSLGNLMLDDTQRFIFIIIILTLLLPAFALIIESLLFSKGYPLLSIICSCLIFVRITPKHNCLYPPPLLFSIGMTQTKQKIIVNSEVDHLAKSFHINFENHFRNTLDSCPRNKFHSFCSK